MNKIEPETDPFKQLIAYLSYIEMSYKQGIKALQQQQSDLEETRAEVNRLRRGISDLGFCFKCFGSQDLLGNCPNCKLRLTD